MNRSAKGFGLMGVVAAVVILMLSAMFGAKAEASPVSTSNISQVYSK